MSEFVDPLPVIFSAYTKFSAYKLESFSLHFLVQVNPVKKEKAPFASESLL